MGELIFIGLGLDDEKGVTLRGLDEAQSSDIVYAERYTSGFSDTSLDAIEKLVGKTVHRLTRKEVEDGEVILAPRDGIASLLKMASSLGSSEFGPDVLAAVLSRVGSPHVRVFAAPIARLAARDLGPPPHCIVIPGSLHFLEKEALVAFAGAPQDL